jgi:hypothetical protein
MNREAGMDGDGIDGCCQGMSDSKSFKRDDNGGFEVCESNDDDDDDDDNDDDAFNASRNRFVRFLFETDLVGFAKTVDGDEVEDSDDDDDDDVDDDDVDNDDDDEEDDDDVTAAAISSC